MKRILVGLDSSSRAPHVLETAIDLAQSRGAKLVLFRAVGVPHDVPREAFSMSPNDLSTMLREHGLKELSELTKSVPQELVDGVEVAVAIPWQGVCDAATQQKADVIVIGSHGYRGLDKVLGTTAAKIVNHADCSVLVVRPEREA